MSLISSEQLTQVFRQLKTKAGANCASFSLSYAHPSHYSNQRAITNLHRAGIKLQILTAEDILISALKDCITLVWNGNNVCVDDISQPTYCLNFMPYHIIPLTTPRAYRRAKSKSIPQKMQCLPQPSVLVYEDGLICRDKSRNSHLWHFCRSKCVDVGICKWRLRWAMAHIYT